MSSLATAYPNALGRGAALFIAGPASLAFIAGRSVNPNIIRETWVPNFTSGEYQEAVALPMPGTTSRPLDVSPEAKVQRDAIWDVVRKALEAVQYGLKADHLCNATPLILDPEKFVQGLRELRFPNEPSNEAFALRVLERQLNIGEPLLDAFRRIGPEAVVAVAQHLIIHELVHDFQNLTHANFRNVGRAAVALEEVDFWADVCAVDALARMRADIVDTTRPLHDVVAGEIDHVLQGIETFDRAEQGDRIARLSERRLRRYLIWDLQRARAATLRSDENVSALLKTRVIAELAPLAGHLDQRYEKVVDKPLNDAEFVVVCDRRLMRFQKSANLDPASLVEHVCAFQRGPILEFMKRVVTEAANVLAPWAILR